jgi:hypothetical protein
MAARSLKRPNFWLAKWILHNNNAIPQNFQQSTFGHKINTGAGMFIVLI